MGQIQMKYGRYILLILLAALSMAIYSAAFRPEPEAPQIAYNYPSLDEVEDVFDICNKHRLSLNARSVLVVDNSNDAWLYAKRPQRVRPIASLTKLLTAMVFLDTRPNLDTIVYISGRDCYNSAKSHLYKGEAYKVIDLLHAALMSSDNRAARAIATASGIPRELFIEKMNEKARSLGMMKTEVVEVTGLDERNTSTAADIAILIMESKRYLLIKKISGKYIYRCKVQNKKRYKRFVNTNRLVRSRWKVTSGKTGFIIESDYCLATTIKNNQDKEITIVILGSPTNNIRFNVARKLANYGFKYAGKVKNGQQIAS